jgi:hypothetical protein
MGITKQSDHESHTSAPVLSNLSVLSIFKKRGKDGRNKFII